MARNTSAVSVIQEAAREHSMSVMKSSRMTLKHLSNTESCVWIFQRSSLNHRLKNINVSPLRDNIKRAA